MSEARETELDEIHSRQRGDRWDELSPDATVRIYQQANIALSKRVNRLSDELATRRSAPPASGTEALRENVDKARAWDAVIAARADEREKCAQIAESQTTNMTGHAAELIYITAKNIADRIRAPSPTEPTEGPDYLGERG